jgi:hypothetical protein
MGLRASLHRWLFRVSGPEAPPIVLGQRRIFVLPTRFGLALALTLLIMLLTSINYTLSLGFALTFLIGSVAWISIHHAFRNLVGLSITRARPTLCSAATRRSSAWSSPTPRSGNVRACLFPTGTPDTLGDRQRFDIAACGSTSQVIRIPTEHRGWISLPRLTLETRHPLGLIRAWSLFQPDARCLVYPAPEQDGPLYPWEGRPLQDSAETGTGRTISLACAITSPATRHTWPGRRWPGRPLAHQGIRWKRRPPLHIHWAHLPAGMGLEARLARHAMDPEADRAGFDYGLSLPGSDIPPGRGQPTATPA